jgi:hypothetical protein
MLSKTVDLYRWNNGEVIGVPIDEDDLTKKDIVAAINNSGATVYVNDTGLRDRVYINIEYDDVYDGEDSFRIDAHLPTERRLRRSLQNADWLLFGLLMESLLLHRSILMKRSKQKLSDLRITRTRC